MNRQLRYIVLILLFTCMGGYMVCAQQLTYVDMGTSVYWASVNIGATQPQDEGEFYAWAETSTKTNYDYSQYKYHTFTWYTKYTSSDGLTELDNTDDVAKVKWGNGWRMPTKQEMQELMDSTTATTVTVGGRKCIQLTSRINGHTILIPLSGFIGDAGKHKNEDEYFFLWSNTLQPSGIYSHAYVLRYYAVIASLAKLEVGTEFRYRGFNVRPARDIPVKLLSISPSCPPATPSIASIQLSISVGDCANAYVMGVEETHYVWIQAEDEGCLVFSQWSDGNTDNPRRILLNRNMSLTAEYVPRQVDVSISVGPQGGGSVEFVENE